MKNFRKSIIALATAAAMLIPSVAMAATLTTTVDKDIDGDVYVGFYDGAVLKDVVKTTVADATVTDAAAAEEATELPCTLTITDEETGIEAADVPGEEVRKLVFTATSERNITGFDIVLSYDTEAVTLISTTDGYYGDIPADQMGYYESEYLMWPYTICSYDTITVRPNGTQSVKTTTFGVATSLYSVIGNRAAVHYAQHNNGNEAPIKDGLVLTEIYYRVNEGKEVTADTFKIETEIGAGTFNEEIGSAGAEVGIKLASKQGSMTYGAWDNGTAVADTIKLVTPWDAPVIPEVTTKTLSVDVPAGAEGYAATMFIWDENQIAQCDPINF